MFCISQNLFCNSQKCLTDFRVFENVVISRLNFSIYLISFFTFNYFLSVLLTVFAEPQFKSFKHSKYLISKSSSDTSNHQHSSSTSFNKRCDQADKFNKFRKIEKRSSAFFFRFPLSECKY